MSKAQVDEIVNKDDTGPVDFPQGLTQNGGAPVGGGGAEVAGFGAEQTVTVTGYDIGALGAGNQDLLDGAVMPANSIITSCIVTVTGAFDGGGNVSGDRLIQNGFEDLAIISVGIKDPAGFDFSLSVLGDWTLYSYESQRNPPSTKYNSDGSAVQITVGGGIGLTTGIIDVILKYRTKI